ncbi:MAG: hypothetical protein ACRYG4_07905 [Janthinobacterium lividum]
MLAVIIDGSISLVLALGLAAGIGGQLARAWPRIADALANDDGPLAREAARRRAVEA